MAGGVIPSGRTFNLIHHTPRFRIRTDSETMKSTFLTIFATAIGLLAIQAGTAHAAVTVTGATLVWAADSSSDPNSYADTIGGNARWNIYVRPAGASDFLNSDDGASTRFEASLSLGDEATWEFFVNSASWGDNSVSNPGSYLNLFVGDRSGPAISARLTGGNTTVIAPLTTAQIDLVPNDADGALVAPAGTLAYQSGGERLVVTGMKFETVGDTVSSFKDLPDPSGVGAPDTMITVNLEVVPEPSTGLLALLGASLLFFRRRR